MIINKFVFPIKADKTFVSGALPQGYLTANDINKDVFYVISPSVGATIIKAKFQNNKQNELPIIVDMLATDIDIKMLVDENASYYDLIKDWNVWQGYFPSKALEYVSYNRAGKIGISFALKQSILPPLPQLEFKGRLVSEDDKMLENGYYIVDTPLYEIDGNSLTFNDVIIKNDNDIIIRKSIVQSGNTGTVEYGVDPSVYGGVDESIDITLTESVIAKLNDNTNEIKYIKLMFDNYYEKNETYNRDEVDNLFEDVNLEIVDLKDDITRIDIKDTEQDAEINELETDILENENNINDINDELVRLENKKFDKIPINNVPFLNALGKVDNRYLDVGEGLELFIIVPELPPIEDAFENKIYLVPNISLFDEQEVFNDFSEYFVFNNKWETLGSVGIDLEDYYNKEETDLINNILRTWVTDNFASKTEFNAHKDNKNNPHEVTAEQVNTYVKTAIDNKDANTLQEAKNYADNKVDKNANITAGTHTKITYDAKGLVTGGEALVAGDIPNLNASKINAGEFDAARIPSLAPTKITQNASNRFVTDVEKNTWNDKQDKLVAGDNISIVGNTISASGGMATVDWQDVENKPELYDKSEIDLMLGDIDTVLDSILGV